MTPEIKNRIEQIRRGEVPEGYKKTRAGIIPVEWQEKDLSDVLKKQTKKNADNSVNNLLTNSATRGIIRQTEYFDKQIANDENKEGYYIVKPGYFVYNPRISVGAPCGPFNKYYGETTGIMSPLYTVYKYADDSQYYSEFLSYYFNSSYWHKYMYGIANYGARSDRMNVTSDDMGSLPLPYPSLPEQKKIAEILAAQDKVIELYQRKIDEIKKLKKICLSKMFPQKGHNAPDIRFPEFTDAWEQRKLGDMGSTYTGLSGKTKDDFGHGNGKFVTYMNVFLNPVSDPDRTESVEIDSAQNEVHYGDVFFTTSSETPEEVGMSSVWLEKSENTYLNSFCFGYRPCEDIDPFYMAYMLRSEAVRNKIVFLAQGISRYNISKTGVMEIAVPIPDLPEQKRIGDYFKQLDNLITLHQRKLEELQRHKKALMQLLLTGIVRVKL